MPVARPVRTPHITCSRASASARIIWPARWPLLTFFLLRRREIDQPIIRTLGWAISVVGLTTLAALAIPNWTPGPVVGAGGYIGAMGRSMLESHFAIAGAYIFTLSVLVAGLLLSTDYFLFRTAAVTTSVTGRSLLHVGHFGHVVRKRARVKTDLEGDAELEEEETDEETDELEEEDADEGDEEAEGDEEEADEDDRDNQGPYAKLERRGSRRGR